MATLDKLAMALGASRADLLRAAGVLDPIVGSQDHAAERRLLALFRDVSDEGQSVIERFARFVHAEEHRWVQQRLVDGAEDRALPPPNQGGPTLFDTLHD